MLEQFGLPYRTTMVGLYAGTYKDELAALAPAQTVPAMRTPRGGILTDSLAMAETLVETHPEIGFYPATPESRALARSMTCEMHSGFGALRRECPQMLAHGLSGFDVSDPVRADLERIDQLWSMARQAKSDHGPWLFGSYSLVDAFYAPVAGRIATYDLPISAAAQAYVRTHLADPAFRRWRAMGLTKSYDPMPYQLETSARPWPGPAPLPAAAITDGRSENRLCPYSQEPVTHLATIAGRTFGFCNAFCRDKTVHDPAAWPAFMALMNR